MTGIEKGLLFAWSALEYPHVFVCSERGKIANFSSLKPRRNAQFPIYIFRFGDVQAQVIF